MIMKKHFLSLLLLSGLIFLNSCNGFLYSEDVPPGGYETKTFDLNSFDNIEAGNTFVITIIPSTESSVTVKGYRRDIDDLLVQNRNGELSIQYKKIGLQLKKIRRYKMEVVIKTNKINELDLSGASNTTISELFELNHLDVDLSGASHLKILGKVGKLDSDISGASELTLLQSVPEIDAEISGASTLHAFDAATQQAFLDLSGASKAKVSVSKLLDVEASGASTVTYKGDPSIKSRLTGASKIKKDQE